MTNNIVLSLSREEYLKIAEAVQMLPWKDVNNLIVNLNNQVMKQVKSEEENKEMTKKQIKKEEIPKK